jgi:hypothetical protein
MKSRKDNFGQQAEEIYEKVKCGYLLLSYGLSIRSDRISLTSILVECRNTQCGPKVYCEFLNSGACKYRSEKPVKKNWFNY